MAKRKFNSKFYNIDFTSLERLSKVPKDTKIVCKVVGELSNDKVPTLKKLFDDYMHDIQETNGGIQFLSQPIVITVEAIPETKEKLKELGLYLSYDKYTYVKHATEDGTLYSGWKTGRKTKIRPEDLPDTYVRCHNYKKNYVYSREHQKIMHRLFGVEHAVLIKSNKACKGCDKSTRTAYVYTEQQFFIIVCKLR